MVYIRESESNSESEFINIELADQNRHNNIIMKNEDRLSMACLGINGCLLASCLAE